ncbi:UNVERIFIED_CONTAM: hypothetical protein NCL1_08872 [Trichonephila clavipes]
MLPVISAARPCRACIIRLSISGKRLGSGYCHAGNGLRRTGGPGAWRPVRGEDSGLPATRAAAADGRGGGRRLRCRQPAAGRGRHRHRQDLRLPGAGHPLRQAHHRLHRHPQPAGPALSSRPAHGAPAARSAAAHGAAQGPQQLPLPVPAAATPGRGRSALEAGRARPAPGRGLGRQDRARRHRRTAGHRRGFACVAAGDQHGRQLSGPGVPEAGRLPAHEGAREGGGGRADRGQSSSVLRRQGAQGPRLRRAAAGGRRRGLRRGPPTARDRRHVLRPEPVVTADP